MFLGTLSLSFFPHGKQTYPTDLAPPPPLPAHDSYMNMYPHLFDPDDWG